MRRRRPPGEQLAELPSAGDEDGLLGEVGGVAVPAREEGEAEEAR